MVDGVPDVVGDVVPPAASEPTDYTSQEVAGRPAARGRCLPSVQSSLCLFGGTDGWGDDDLGSVFLGPCCSDSRRVGLRRSERAGVGCLTS